MNYAFSSGNHRFASFIAILSTLGITIGVAALIIVLSVMNGLEAELKDRILSTVSHAEITTPRDTIKESYNIEEYLKISGVNNIYPMAIGEVIIQGRQGIAGVKLQGIDPSKYPEIDLIRASIGSDAFSYIEPRSYEISMGQTLADSLGVNEGDSVRIIAPSNVRYTAFGKVPAQRIFKIGSIFSVGIGDAEDSLVLANIEDARKLLKIKSDEVSSFRVWLQEPYDISSFIESAQRLDPNIVIKDWRKEKGDFFQSVAFEKIMMGLMLALIILVAIFNMLSSLAMVVTSKLSEIAILRTLGVSKSTIVGCFMVEGSVSSIIGSILGLALGLTLTINLNQVLSTFGLSNIVMMGGLPHHIIPSQIVIIVVCTVLLGLLITLYPALKAAHTKPVKFLRYE